MIKCDNLPGKWPFPPHDAHTTIHRVALEKAAPKHHTGLHPTAVRARVSQFASVGGIVRLTFSKGTLPPQRWVGVVVEKRPLQCRIRWFGIGRAESDRVLWFPAPRPAPRASCCYEGFLCSSTSPWSRPCEKHGQTPRAIHRAHPSSARKTPGGS